MIAQDQCYVLEPAHLNKSDLGFLRPQANLALFSFSAGPRCAEQPAGSGRQE